MQDVLAAESADGALANPLALADALHEVEISMPPGDFLADEHTDVVSRTDANIKSVRTQIRKCFHYTFPNRPKLSIGIERFQELTGPDPPLIRGSLLKLGQTSDAARGRCSRSTEKKSAAAVWKAALFMAPSNAEGGRYPV